MKFPFFLLLLLLTPAALALELFGVDLQSASRDQFRAAVNNAGVKLVQQAGDDRFFDTYKADSILPGARYLYLGFTKKERSFAFAEYRFPGLRHDALLAQLKARYGKPESRRPGFLSDQRNTWRDGEIEISLYTDWPNYSLRLVYFHPQRLETLRAEHKAFLARASDANDFMPQGY